MDIQREIPPSAGNIQFEGHATELLRQIPWRSSYGDIL